MGRCLLIAVLALWCSCHLLFPFETRGGGDNPPDAASAGEGITHDQSPSEQPGSLETGAQDAPAGPDRGAGEQTRPLETAPCCPYPQCCSGCVPVPKGSSCTTPAGYPGECDGAGQCLECIPQGSQCGSTDPKDCCGGLVCANWGGGAHDTCGP